MAVYDVSTSHAFISMHDHICNIMHGWAKQNEATTLRVEEIRSCMCVHAHVYIYVYAHADHAYNWACVHTYNIHDIYNSIQDKIVNLGLENAIIISYV